VPGLKPFPATRIVAAPPALDAAAWPDRALVLRPAPDEAFIFLPVDEVAVGDPHAIIVAEDGFLGAWVPAEAALAFLERACAWELPSARPAFAQGAVANLPVKLWFEADRVLFLVPAPFAADLEDRMA
jgi:hypothetical protein